MSYYQKTELRNELKITEIYSFHSFEYVKDFKGIEEKHDFWELVYVNYGKITIISDTERYILKDGEMFLHKPNEAHNVLAKDYASVIIVSFDCDNSHLSCLGKKKLRLYAGEKRIMEELFQAGTDAFLEPWDIFDEKKVKLNHNAKYGSQQLVCSYLEILLIMFIQREMGTMNSCVLFEQQKDINEKFEQIEKILHAYLYGRIDIKKLCMECGLSRSYVAKLFKEITNMGVMDYYNQLKIKEAKKLISEGELFTVIAEKLNYSSVHYFSKTFKRIANMTPSGYKKLIKNKKTI